MKIIGEKINGTRKRVAQAIQERDGAFIQNLACEQAAAGTIGSTPMRARLHSVSLMT